MALRFLTGAGGGMGAFLVGWMASITQLTMIGFLTTLYCLLAAGMSAWEVTRSGEVNRARVFTVPAFVGVGLMVLLYKV